MQTGPCDIADIPAAGTALNPRFLDGLASSEIASIVAAASIQSFRAKALIVDQGNPSDRFFLLLTGRARFFVITPDGKKVILLWLPPGEITGSAAFLLKPMDYLVSTEAIEDTCALMWERNAIRHQAEQHPKLVENMLWIMTDYLVAYTAAHIALISGTARERLARVLGNLVIGFGRKTLDGIELDVRNEELANEANVTMFTASRLLNEWQRMDILDKRRGKVLVRSLERLLREC